MNLSFLFAGTRHPSGQGSNGVLPRDRLLKKRDEQLRLQALQAQLLVALFQQAVTGQNAIRSLPRGVACPSEQE